MMTPILILIGITIVVVGYALYKRPVKKADLPADYKRILTEHVAFYRALDEE
jgi:hypothetical protein